METYMIYLMIYFTVCLIIIFRGDIERLYLYFFEEKKYRLVGKIISLDIEEYQYPLQTFNLENNYSTNNFARIKEYFVLLQSKNKQIFKIQITQRSYNLLSKGKKILISCVKTDFENIFRRVGKFKLYT